MRRNFEYDTGPEPWAHHIPTAITTTLHELALRSDYLRSLVCCGDSTDTWKTPYREIAPVCLEGHGAKMVIPQGYPSWTSEIVVSPETGGLFEQAHMVKKIPAQFYETGPGSNTKYFLVPFEDYEIPVYSVRAPKMFLPLWKHFLFTENEMSEVYFDDHIRVIGAYSARNDRQGIQREFFHVEYYFFVDWAYVKLHDIFLVSYDSSCLAEMIDSTALGESYRTFETTLPSLPWNQRKSRTTKLILIDTVLSQDEIVERIEAVSPLLGFDINKHLRVSPAGDLQLRLWGTIDYDSNKCIYSEITLTDGSMTAVSPRACWVR